MYQSIFVRLSEATKLIARQLIQTRPAESLNEASALDMARKELVQALFDGAVRSEGVNWIPPVAEDPSEPPELPEPDKWEPIDAGWWSHERYEPYMEHYPDTPKPLRFLFPQVNYEETQPSAQSYVVKGWNLLDLIYVRWEDNSFEPIGSEGDYVYARIRLYRADVEACFGKTDKTPRFSEAKIQNKVIECKQRPDGNLPEKLRTKPDDLRVAVDTWFKHCVQEKGCNWIIENSDPWLAERYLKAGVPPVGHADYIRKLIAALRKVHGLTRKPKSS